MFFLSVHAPATCGLYCLHEPCHGDLWILMSEKHRMIFYRTSNIISIIFTENSKYVLSLSLLAKLEQRTLWWGPTVLLPDQQRFHFQTLSYIISLINNAGQVFPFRQIVLFSRLCCFLYCFVLTCAPVTVRVRCRCSKQRASPWTPLKQLKLLN